MGWAGTRSATKPSFDTIGCGASDVARKTTVYGPGRFFAQNASAIAVRCPKRKTSPTSATEIETGKSRGRDFAAYNFSTAPAWNGSAASPYTVSVGCTTRPPAPRMSRIRDILGAGGLVVHPTDTEYGLAADPFQAGAVEKLYAAKSRPRDLPVSISVADVGDVFRFGQRTAIAEAFCAKNLPGPYTVVLSATSEAPQAIVSKDGLIALRVPAHPISRLLAKSFGPVTSTSANRHGQPAPSTCEDAREQLGDRVDLYVDGGPTLLGGESTVVDLSGPRAKILRQGPIRPGA